MRLIMKKLILSTVSAALTFFFVPFVAAQTEDLKALGKEIEALKEGQKAMQKDLEEIKTLLRSRPTGALAAPQNPVISIEGAHFKGEKTAKLTLIEFSDFQ